MKYTQKNKEELTFFMIGILTGFGIGVILTLAMLSSVIMSKIDKQLNDLSATISDINLGLEEKE